jgi:hypothetical protein
VEALRGIKAELMNFLHTGFRRGNDSGISAEVVGLHQCRVILQWPIENILEQEEGTCMSESKLFVRKDGSDSGASNGGQRTPRNSTSISLCTAEQGSGVSTGCFRKEQMAFIMH